MFAAKILRLNFFGVDTNFINFPRSIYGLVEYVSLC